MDIEIKLDSNYNIPKVIIYTNKVTDEVNNILKQISEQDKAIKEKK